jgi:hypothetical protein
VAIRSSRSGRITTFHRASGGGTNRAQAAGPRSSGRSAPGPRRGRCRPGRRPHRRRTPARAVPAPRPRAPSEPDRLQVQQQRVHGIGPGADRIESGHDLTRVAAPGAGRPDPARAGRDRPRPARQHRAAQHRLRQTRLPLPGRPTVLHGPYLSWIRKSDGKPITRKLTPEQEQRYRPWFDNTRRLQELIAELQALSVQAIENAEGWQNRPQP